jgi:DNA-binding Lrp family transcriptional regulator
MTTQDIADSIDAVLLQTLNRDPDVTTVSLAEQTGLARNTVRARLARYASRKTLRSFERRIDPAFLGFPLSAYILAKVTQRKLAPVCAALSKIPEVLEVHGLSGVADLLVLVVAKDADDLYRVAGRILNVPGIKRTSTSLVMRRLIDYRIMQLIRQ